VAVQWLNQALCIYQSLCLVDSEVLNSSFVHLMNFSAEKPRLRKAAKRQDVKKLNFSLESIKIDFVKLDWK
jgi:hypothetical protein